MKKTETISIIPHDDKVLLKVSKESWDSRFSKYVTTTKGEKVELFVDIEEDEGFDKKFQQNISLGVVLAVGKNVTGVLRSDMAIIDYLVTTTDNALVGFINGDMILAIDGNTTYHEDDSDPQMNGRHAYFKGDFDGISKLLGVVRAGKIISRSPYVFLRKEDHSKIVVSGGGVMHKNDQDLCNRKVLSSGEGSICKEGDVVIIKESDLFSRVINGKEVSVIFETDILAVK